MAMKLRNRSRYPTGSKRKIIAAAMMPPAAFAFNTENNNSPRTRILTNL